MGARVLVLTSQDMREALGPEDCAAIAKDALALVSSGLSETPPQGHVSIPQQGGDVRFSYGYVVPSRAFGVSVDSEYPANTASGIPSRHSTMLLMDAETGRPRVLLDGACLSTLRSLGVSAAATDVLSKRSSTTLAVFGDDERVADQVDAAMCVRDISEVRVFSARPGVAEGLAKGIRAKLKGTGVGVLVAPSADRALAGADVVTCVTDSYAPVFDGSLVEPGTHVNALGDKTADRVEVDEYLVCHARVYADTFGGVFGMDGDVMQPIQRGRFSGDRLMGELGQVIVGHATGRTWDDQTTLFECAGSAAVDVVFAQRVYEVARDARLGTKVDL
jgi:ornithine cyclodeaminase